jgi:hypothetical protein
MLLKPLRLFLEWYNKFPFGSVPIANRAQLPVIVYFHPWVGFGADAEAGGTAMGRVNSVSLCGAGVALGGPSRGAAQEGLQATVPRAGSSVCSSPTDPLRPVTVRRPWPWMASAQRPRNPRSENILQIPRKPFLCSGQAP